VGAVRVSAMTEIPDPGTASALNVQAGGGPREPREEWHPREPWEKPE
jgi:hypothetical protein